MDLITFQPFTTANSPHGHIPASRSQHPRIAIGHVEYRRFLLSESTTTRRTHGSSDRGASFR